MKKRKSKKTSKLKLSQESNTQESSPDVFEVPKKRKSKILKQKSKRTKLQLTTNGNDSQSSPKEVIEINSDDDDFEMFFSQSPTTVDSNPTKSFTKKQATSSKVSSDEFWCDKHKPLRFEDLCITKKKKEEVLQIIKQMISNSSTGRRIYTLILVGPPGCGKKTLIEIIAKELNLEMVTYDEPSSEFRKNMDPDMQIPYISRMSHFRQFLQQTTRFNNLFSTNQRLVVINELPFVKDREHRQQRDEILMKYCCPEKSDLRLNPVVILHTLYDAPTLNADLFRNFPQEMTHHKHVAVIQMKPVTEKRIINILQQILQREKFNNTKNLNSNVSRTTLKAIAESSFGDLRSAINQLQFKCMRISKPKKKKYKVKLKTITKETSKHPEFVKDESLDLHHAAARILYGKRTSDGKLEFDIEKVAHSVHADEKVLISYVHHNALDFCTEVEDLEQVFEHFSLADTFTKYNPQYYAAQSFGNWYQYTIASRGLLFYNKHPAKFVFRPIRAPLIQKTFFDSTDNKKRALDMFEHSSNGTSLSNCAILEEIVPYMKIINSGIQRNRSLQQQHNLELSNAQIFFLNSLHKYTFRGSNQRYYQSSDGNDLLEAYNEDETQQEEVTQNPVSTYTVTDFRNGKKVTEVRTLEEDIEEE